MILLYAMYSSFVKATKNRSSVLLRVISVLVFGLSTWYFVQRDTYLPFLGPTALPSSLLRDSFSPKDSNVETDIFLDVPDGTRVLYWGATSKEDSKTIVPSPMLAYGNYTNAGIAVVNKGKARIRFLCPVKYQVPWGKTLDRHIHYRIATDDAMLGRIETVYVNC